MGTKKFILELLRVGGSKTIEIMDDLNSLCSNNNNVVKVESLKVCNLWILLMSIDSFVILFYSSYVIVIKEVGYLRLNWFY